MRSREVWELVLRVVADAFSENSVHTASGIDEMTEVELAKKSDWSLSEVALVRRCVYGVTRFAPLCHGAFQGYCDCYKRNTSSKDAMYLIAYLLIFEYKDLGGSVVRDLLDGSMASVRITEYVEYLLSVDALQLHSVPLWKATYDDAFLRLDVLAPLSAIVADAKSHIIGYFGSGPRMGKFALSSPPIVPLMATPNAADDDPAMPPIPAVTRTPSNYQRLPPYEVRQMAYTIPEPRPPKINLNPKPSRSPSVKPPTRPIGFHFHTRAASTSSPKAAESEPSSPLGFERTSSSKLKLMLSSSVAVPMTVTTLRREMYLRAKQHEEASRELDRLEAGTRDATEYELWRRNQLHNRAVEEEQARVQRFLSAIQAGEHIRAQREQAKQDRHRRLQEMKECSAREAEMHARQRQAAAQLHREETLERRERQVAQRLAAEAKVVAEKRASAYRVKKEKDLLRAAVVSATEERKVQQAMLIQEIRQLRERIRRKKVEMVEERRLARLGAGNGTDLGQMTLLELRSELDRIQQEEAAVDTERHEHAQTLRAKDQTERERLELECEEQRQQHRQQRDMLRRQTAANTVSFTNMKASQSTARMIALQQKLTEKRELKQREDLRTREEERQRRHDLLIRAEDGSAMERRRWEQYESALARRAQSEQRALAVRFRSSH